MSRRVKIAVLFGVVVTGCALLLAGLLTHDSRWLALGLLAWMLVLIALAMGLRNIGIALLWRLDAAEARQGTFELLMQSRLKGMDKRHKELHGRLLDVRTRLRAAARSRAEVAEKLSAELEQSNKSTRKLANSMRGQVEDVQRLMLRTFRALELEFRSAEDRAQAMGATLEEQLASRDQGIALMARKISEQNEEARDLLLASFRSLEKSVLLWEQQVSKAWEDSANTATTVGDRVDLTLRELSANDRLPRLARKVFDQVKPDILVDISALQALQDRVPDVREKPSMTRYSMEPAAMLAVIEIILSAKPCMVVELGSGASTLWIAGALARLGKGRLISVEHDEIYYQQTAGWLEDNGLADWVDLRHVPVRQYGLNDGQVTQWYDSRLLNDVEKIDILLVDGPPQSLSPQARLPAFEQLRDRLVPGARIFVDDATRPDEIHMMRAWRELDNKLSAPTTVVGRLALLTYASI